MATNKDFVVKNGLQVGANTSIAGSITTVDSVQFDLTAAIDPIAEGQLVWNADHGTLALGIDGADMDLHIGEDLIIKVKAAVALTRGDLVYASGSVGNSGAIEVSPYLADGSINQNRIIGIAGNTIAQGEFGYVVKEGEIRKINAGGNLADPPEAWTDGTILYASATTAGKLTKTAPTAPNQSIAVAFVVSNSTNGILQVRVTQLGFTLDELHNVSITSVANNQVLTYDGVNSRWSNSSDLNLPGNMNVGGNIVIDGNFTVSGNTTLVNTNELSVEDLNIVLASGAADGAAADGAGITIDGANATLIYDDFYGSWKFNKELRLLNNNGLFWDIAAGGSSTGIKTDTSDRITFRTGGFWDRLVVTNNGYVGIGKNDPVAELNVDGRIVADAGEQSNPTGGESLVIDYQTIGDYQGRIRSRDWDGATWKDFSVEANDIKLLPAGNVGIGENNPDRLLHITDSSSAIMRFTGNGNNGAGNQYASIEFENAEDAAASFTIDAKIHVESSETNGNGGEMVFSTGVEGHSEALRITEKQSLYTTQVRHSTNPVFLADFANSKTITHDIDVSRNSIASYIGEDGYMKYATKNEPRFDHDPSSKESLGLLVEEEVTNLLEFSNNFTEWSTYYNTGIYPNAGIAPDGTFTATELWAVNEGIGGGYRTIYTTFANTAVEHVFSIYVKAVYPGQSISLAISTASYVDGNVAAYFTINGSEDSGVSNGFPYVVKDAGNGWYRVSIRFTPSGQYVSFGYRLSATFGHGSGNYIDNPVYIWGAQCEIGHYMTSYIPSTYDNLTRAEFVPGATYIDSTGVLRQAGVNKKRYGYMYDRDSDSYVSAGVIFENSTTNLFDDSNGFQNWGDDGGDIVTDTTAVLAPDNTYSAEKLVQDTTPSNHSRFKSWGVTSAGGHWSTVSVFARKAELQFLNISIFYECDMGASDNHAQASYDLETGEVTKYTANGGNPIARSEYVGKGWWRCSITFRIAPTPTQSQYAFISAQQTANDGLAQVITGNGSDGIYVWGAQRELPGSTNTTYIGPTSYIRTRASHTRTRPADIAVSRDSNDFLTRTRKADDITISNFNYANKNGGTWYTITQRAFVNEDGGRSVFDAVDTSDYSNVLINRLRTFFRAGGNSGFVSGVQNYPGSGSVTQISLDPQQGNIGVNEEARIAVRVKKNDYMTAYNGALGESSTSFAHIPKYDKILIGSVQDTQYPHLNGHIKKIVYYNEHLTDNELQALTEE